MAVVPAVHRREKEQFGIGELVAACTGARVTHPETTTDDRDKVTCRPCQLIDAGHAGLAAQVLETDT